MKKLLFVLAIGAFAACGSGANSDATKDSTAKDSTTMMAPMDTTGTAQKTADSIKAKAMADSVAAKAAADSAKAAKKKK